MSTFLRARVALSAASFVLLSSCVRPAKPVDCAPTKAPAPAPAPAVPVFLDALAGQEPARITSYNVCYTKLLRFGYDPVFMHPDSGLSFAEMTPGQKAAVSHRGAALRLLVEYLQGPESPLTGRTHTLPRDS